MSGATGDDDDVSKLFHIYDDGEKESYGEHLGFADDDQVTPPPATTPQSDSSVKKDEPPATQQPISPVNKMDVPPATSASAFTGPPPPSKTTAATPPVSTEPPASTSSSSNWRQVLFNGPSLMLSKNGPIYLLAFFLASSVIYGDLRGYMLLSMVLLGLLMAYAAMAILDWILRAALKLASIKPMELNSKQSVSCLALEFGTFSVGQKLNLSIFIYFFTMIYLMTCASSQYYNSRSLVPKFTTFIIFFIFLTIHAMFMSIFRVCSVEDAQRIIDKEIGSSTLDSEEANNSGVMGVTSTVVYYNLLTLALSGLFGFACANIIIKSGSPELIYFHPKNENDVCKRSDNTEFTCDITPAS